MNIDYPILILDDEIDICFLLSIFLKKQFMRVDSIHSISELSQINLLEYKLIFIDNNLSDGSGFDEIINIKRINSQIKVIAISAFDTSKEKMMAMEKGADIFLGKPFNQEEILSVVNRMMLQK
jgi:DNA-binding response OmpR family regulator